MTIQGFILSCSIISCLPALNGFQLLPSSSHPSFDRTILVLRSKIDTPINALVNGEDNDNDGGGVLT